VLSVDDTHGLASSVCPFSVFDVEHRKSCPLVFTGFWPRDKENPEGRRFLSGGHFVSLDYSWPND
jgi:hypothetical protein